MQHAESDSSILYKKCDNINDKWRILKFWFKKRGVYICVLNCWAQNKIVLRNKQFWNKQKKGATWNDRSHASDLSRRPSVFPVCSAKVLSGFSAGVWELKSVLLMIRFRWEKNQQFELFYQSLASNDLKHLLIIWSKKKMFSKQLVCLYSSV